MVVESVLSPRLSQILLDAMAHQNTALPRVPPVFSCV